MPYRGQPLFFCVCFDRHLWLLERESFATKSTARLLLPGGLYYIVNQKNSPRFELTSLGIPENWIRQISWTAAVGGPYGGAALAHSGRKYDDSIRHPS